MADQAAGPDSHENIYDGMDSLDEGVQDGHAEDLYGGIINYSHEEIEKLVLMARQLNEDNMELVNANQQLKRELQTLQKSREVLKRNFSSLLLTARAEIERKDHRLKELQTSLDKTHLRSVRRLSSHDLDGLIERRARELAAGQDDTPTRAPKRRGGTAERRKPKRRSCDVVASLDQNNATIRVANSSFTLLTDQVPWRRRKTVTLASQSTPVIALDASPPRAGDQSHASQPTATAHGRVASPSVECLTPSCVTVKRLPKPSPSVECLTPSCVTVKRLSKPSATSRVASTSGGECEVVLVSANQRTTPPTSSNRSASSSAAANHGDAGTAPTNRSSRRRINRGRLGVWVNDNVASSPVIHADRDGEKTRANDVILATDDVCEVVPTVLANRRSKFTDTVGDDTASPATVCTRDETPHAGDVTPSSDVTSEAIPPALANGRAEKRTNRAQFEAAVGDRASSAVVSESHTRDVSPATACDGETARPAPDTVAVDATAASSFAAETSASPSFKSLKSLGKTAAAPVSEALEAAGSLAPSTQTVASLSETVRDVATPSEVVQAVPSLSETVFADPSPPEVVQGIPSLSETVFAAPSPPDVVQASSSIPEVARSTTSSSETKQTAASLPEGVHTVTFPGTAEAAPSSSETEQTFHPSPEIAQTVPALTETIQADRSPPGTGPTLAVPETVRPAASTPEAVQVAASPSQTTPTVVSLPEAVPDAASLPEAAPSAVWLSEAVASTASLPAHPVPLKKRTIKRTSGAGRRKATFSDVSLPATGTAERADEASTSGSRSVADAATAASDDVTTRPGDSRSGDDLIIDVQFCVESAVASDSGRRPSESERPSTVPTQRAGGESRRRPGAAPLVNAPLEPQRDGVPSLADAVAASTERACVWSVANARTDAQRDVDSWPTGTEACEPLDLSVAGNSKALQVARHANIDGDKGVSSEAASTSSAVSRQPTEVVAFDVGRSWTQVRRRAATPSPKKRATARDRKAKQALGDRETDASSEESADGSPRTSGTKAAQKRPWPAGKNLSVKKEKSPVKAESGWDLSRMKSALGDNMSSLSRLSPVACPERADTGEKTTRSRPPTADNNPARKRNSPPGAESGVALPPAKPAVQLGLNWSVFDPVASPAKPATSSALLATVQKSARRPTRTTGQLPAGEDCPDGAISETRLDNAEVPAIVTGGLGADGSNIADMVCVNDEESPDANKSRRTAIGGRPEDSNPSSTLLTSTVLDVPRGQLSTMVATHGVQSTTSPSRGPAAASPVPGSPRGYRARPSRGLFATPSPCRASRDSPSPLRMPELALSSCENERSSHCEDRHRPPSENGIVSPDVMERSSLPKEDRLPPVNGECLPSQGGRSSSVQGGCSSPESGRSSPDTRCSSSASRGRDKLAVHSSDGYSQSDSQSSSFSDESSSESSSAGESPRKAVRPSTFHGDPDACQGNGRALCRSSSEDSRSSPARSVSRAPSPSRSSRATSRSPQVASPRFGCRSSRDPGFGPVKGSASMTSNVSGVSPAKYAANGLLRDQCFSPSGDTRLSPPKDSRSILSDNARLSSEEPMHILLHDLSLSLSRDTTFSLSRDARSSEGSARGALRGLGRSPSVNARFLTPGDVKSIPSEDARDIASTDAGPNVLADIGSVATTRSASLELNSLHDTGGFSPLSHSSGDDGSASPISRTATDTGVASPVSPQSGKDDPSASPIPHISGDYRPTSPHVHSIEDDEPASPLSHASEDMGSDCPAVRTAGDAGDASPLPHMPKDDGSAPPALCTPVDARVASTASHFAVRHSPTSPLSHTSEDDRSPSPLSHTAKDTQVASPVPHKTAEDSRTPSLVCKVPKDAKVACSVSQAAADTGVSSPVPQEVEQAVGEANDSGSDFHLNVDINDDDLDYEPMDSPAKPSPLPTSAVASYPGSIMTPSSAGNDLDSDVGLGSDRLVVDEEARSPPEEGECEEGEIVDRSPSAAIASRRIPRRDVRASDGENGTRWVGRPGGLWSATTTPFESRTSRRSSDRTAARPADRAGTAGGSPDRRCGERSSPRRLRGNSPDDGLADGTCGRARNSERRPMVDRIGWRRGGCPSRPDRLLSQEERPRKRQATEVYSSDSDGRCRSPPRTWGRRGLGRERRPRRGVAAAYRDRRDAREDRFRPGEDWLRAEERVWPEGRTRSGEGRVRRGEIRPREDRVRSEEDRLLSGEGRTPSEGDRFRPVEHKSRRGTSSRNDSFASRNGPSGSREDRFSTKEGFFRGSRRPPGFDGPGRRRGRGDKDNAYHWKRSRENSSDEEKDSFDHRRSPPRDIDRQGRLSSSGRNVKRKPGAASSDTSPKMFSPPNSPLLDDQSQASEFEPIPNSGSVTPEMMAKQGANLSRYMDAFINGTAYHEDSVPACAEERGSIASPPPPPEEARHGLVTRVAERDPNEVRPARCRGGGRAARRKVAEDPRPVSEFNAHRALVSNAPSEAVSRRESVASQERRRRASGTGAASQPAPARPGRSEVQISDPEAMSQTVSVGPLMRTSDPEAVRDVVSQSSSRSIPQSEKAPRAKFHGRRRRHGPVAFGDSDSNCNTVAVTSPEAIGGVAPGLRADSTRHATHSRSRLTSSAASEPPGRPSATRVSSPRQDREVTPMPDGETPRSTPSPLKRPPQRGDSSSDTLDRLARAAEGVGLPLLTCEDSEMSLISFCQ